MSDQPGRQALSGKKKAAFTGALLVGAFLLAEVGVRLTKPHADLWVDTGRKSGPDPKSKWANLDAFSAYVARPGSYGVDKVKTVNSHGFISTPEITVEKPAGTQRLAFIGGSSTAGTGFDPLLSDPETWPWQVTETLRERHPGQAFDFLNCGQSGFTSFESYGRLWSRVRFFRPDVLVVYHGWNDLYFFDGEAMDEIHRWRIRPDGNWGLYMQLAILEPSWVDHFIWWSQILIKVRWKLHGKVSGELGSGHKELKPDIDTRFLEVWREHLRLYKAAADLLGAELFVCKQATLIVPGLAEADQERCSYDHHGFDHDAHVKAYDAFYAVIDEEVPANRVIDTTSLSGRPDLFDDHVHINAAGAKEVARIVSEKVSAELYGD